MKSRELHRKLIKGGCIFIKQDATSHRHYEKDGKIIIVPYHGSDEVGKGLASKILKQAGLK